MTEEQPRRLPGDYFERPSAARVWNYWLGGRDNYPVDQAAGDAVAAVYPGVVQAARESREFLVRSVHYLAAEAGIRQFIDVGMGLPAARNTHDVAQSVAADSKIVYVDNDPIVLAHARAWLTGSTAEGRVSCVDADLRKPDSILAEARGALDLEEPVALLFIGVLGLIADFHEARQVVSKLLEALPSGSYLVLEDGTDTGSDISRGAAKYAASGAIPYHLRSPEQITEFFTGLELVEPGVVPTAQWRLEAEPNGQVATVDRRGGVARKP